MNLKLSKVYVIGSDTAFNVNFDLLIYSGVFLLGYKYGDYAVWPLLEDLRLILYLKIGSILRYQQTLSGFKKEKKNLRFVACVSFILDST